MAHPPLRPVRDWVALTLAIGISTGINVITAGVLIDALVSDGPGLSENATQLLTAAFGGIIGVLGSYVGYRAATQHRDRDQDPPGSDDPV